MHIESRFQLRESGKVLESKGRRESLVVPPVLPCVKVGGHRVAHEPGSNLVLSFLDEKQPSQLFQWHQFIVPGAI
jgi:hypothetical protein